MAEGSKAKHEIDLARTGSNIHTCFFNLHSFSSLFPNFKCKFRALGEVGLSRNFSYPKDHISRLI